MREGRIRTQAVSLALCDTMMVLLAMQIAWWLRFDVNAWLGANYGLNPFALGWTPGQPYVMAIFVTLPVFWLILREMNLYSAPEDGAGEFFRLCAGSLFATVLLAAISFYIRVNYEHEQFQYSRAYAILFLPVSVICLSLGRIIFRAVLRSLSRQGIGQNRILFVGDGPLAEELSKALNARGTNLVIGTLAQKDASTATGDAAVFSLPVLGDIDQLVSIAQERNCDEVIVAIPDAPQAMLKQLAEDCYRAHVRFRMVPDVYEMLLDHMDLSLVGDIPLLGMRGSRIEGINFLCKRLFDIVVSALLLIVLVPFVFVPAVLAIKFTDKGPAFYFQERIGYRRRKFRFWKLRTMKVGADAGANVEIHKNYLKKYISGSADGATDAKGRTVYKITHDPRVTPLGRLLRQFSIDELPQLWNVLIGDMSLIGPRPPIAYEVENYRPIHLRRFEVLPGISGLWQVSGRNQLTFEEMVKLDLYYIENWSLELDVRILFKTISVVLFQRAH
jgi:exopolysaccharide biosynthesis polyprenyl glycosylphosphotransferase